MIRFDRVPDKNQRLLEFLYSRRILKQFLINVLEDEEVWGDMEEVFNEPSVYMSSILSGAFSWSASKEGGVFWNKIHSLLCEMEGKNG